MEPIIVHEKKFVPFLTSDVLQHRIRVMAAEISRDLAGKEPLLLSVLNGSFMFASDLMKSMTIPLEISFVKMASYHGTRSSGAVRCLIGLDEKISDRHIVIVEDIIDTGVTMAHLLSDLQEFHPASIKIAALLFKPEAFSGTFEIDYCGFSIPNNFVVGYGLDYDGHGRNYPDIYTLETKT
ncbi:MAG: hypoxanthine phosphoribosyltransferase [Bacteroidales bacterium]